MNRPFLRHQRATQQTAALAIRLYGFVFLRSQHVLHYIHNITYDTVI